MQKKIKCLCAYNLSCYLQNILNKPQGIIYINLLSSFKEKSVLRVIHRFFDMPENILYFHLSQLSKMFPFSRLKLAPRQPGWVFREQWHTHPKCRCCCTFHLCLMFVSSKITWRHFWKSSKKECKYWAMCPEDSTSAVQMPHRGIRNGENCGNLRW